MTVADVLAHFPGPRVRSGATTKVTCPCHADQTPSLAIAKGEHGGVVMTCHAGCATETVVAAVGLTMADLMNGNGASRPVEVARYPYRDEHGALLYEKVRLEPKRFYIAPANGAKTLDGVRRVIYRLDALAEEPRVFVAEGEKDVDRLWALHIPATCNDSGASEGGKAPKWRDEYSRQLTAAGCTSVVIVPDEDAPGLAHADAVARSCHAAGLTVRVVRLPGLAPDSKQDTADWLDAGHDAHELLALADAAPEWSPDADATTAPGASDWRLLSFAELLQQPDPAWLVDGILPARGLAVLYGPSGAAKTTCIAGVLGSIATGRPWFGRSILTPGACLYVAAEDVAGFKVRLRAWTVDAGVPDVAVWTFPQAVSLLEPAAVERFLTLVRGQQTWRAVVFDTYAASIEGGQENSGEVSQVAAGLARRVGDALSCLAGIVHHSNAQGTRERGHTGLRGSADTMISLAPVDDTIEVDCSKQRNGPPFPRFHLRLRPQPAGGCILVPATSGHIDGPLTTGQRKALDTLRQSFGHGGATKTEWAKACPDIADRTFYRIAENLQARGRVQQRGARFYALADGADDVD